MRQLTAYLPDEVYATMAALSGDEESVNAYIRAAVQAENRRRMFAGMDGAIAATVGRDVEAAWHAANAAIIESGGRAAQG